MEVDIRHYCIAYSPGAFRVLVDAQTYAEADEKVSMKRFFSQAIPQGLKNYYHLAQAFFACVYFRFPARELKVIGVTGTNGKTTTVQFIARILERAGKKIAVASTINFQIGGQKWVNASKFTTLSPWELQSFLRAAARAECEYAVLEISSHALDQNRVWGVPYAIAVLTNVTREHLDYHKTMAEYRRIKRKLFFSAKQAVINSDIDDPEYFHTHSNKTVLFYSVKNSQADAFAEKIELERAGTDFTLKGARFHLNMPGLFNVENALAALCVARLLEIDFSVARETLKSIGGVPGRMERVPNTRGLNIILDYAVTPDAFEKLYASVLPFKLPDTQVIHVFGACGERDRGKRPEMGAIASEYADMIILTNEDPYYEDAERILDEIEQGVSNKKKNPARNIGQGVVNGYFRIFDRREAIHKAITLAKSGDIILITGKGAEMTLAVRDKRIPWNERRVIEEELAKISVKPTAG